jgi:hypothetical protein
MKRSVRLRFITNDMYLSLNPFDLHVTSFNSAIYQRAAVEVGVAYVSLQLAVYFELPTIV